MRTIMLFLKDVVQAMVLVFMIVTGSLCSLSGRVFAHLDVIDSRDKTWIKENFGR